VGIAIVRKRVGHATPGRDAIGVERDDIIRFDRLQGLLRDLHHITGRHNVASPIGGVDQYIVIAGTGRKRGDNLLEEFTKGKGLQHDIAAGRLFPDWSFIEDGTSDCRAGLRYDDDGLARKVLRANRRHEGNGQQSKQEKQFVSTHGYTP